MVNAMAVDFGILERTPTIGSRFMEGQQAAQQQAERNMLRQMQMQQMAIQQENMLAQRENLAAQREERLAQSEQRRAATAEALARRQRLAAIGEKLGAGALTEEGLRQALQQAVIHGDPQIVQAVMKLRDDFNAERDYARVYGGAPTPAPAGAAPATVPTGAPAVEAEGEAPVNAMLAQAAPAVEPAPTAAPATAAVPTAAPGAPQALQYGGYTYTPAQIDVMRRSRDPRLREEYAKIAAAEAARQLKQMELGKPTFKTRVRGDITEELQIKDGLATVVPGSQAAIGLTKAQELQDQRERERIKIDGQRLGLEGRRLAMAERDSALSKDPAFQQQMAAARAKGEAIAKGETAAKLALPGAIANAEDVINIIDQMVGKQEVRDKNNKIVQAATKPHPGFENAVGTTWLPGARFNPGTDAANFQALFDQTQGAAFLEAYNLLRGAGAITNDEGKKATAARSRMSLAQSEAEFIAAAREYQSIIRKGLKVLKEKSGAGGGATGDWSIVR